MALHTDLMLFQTLNLNSRPTKYHHYRRHHRLLGLEYNCFINTFLCSCEAISTLLCSHHETTSYSIF